jgi:hypothetical protein
MLVALGVSIVAGSCERSGDPSPRQPPPIEVSGGSVEERYGAMRTIRLAGGRAYDLHSFPVELARAELVIDDLRFERDLRTSLTESGARIVVNGGFWDRDNEPEGLAISGGRELTPFDLELGGGVLVVRNRRAELLDAEEFTLPSDVDFAVQCKPRLVVGGANNLRRDDGRRAQRTALCIRDEGRVVDLILAVSEVREAGPSLYELALALVEHGCEQALNLDGGPSSGAVWREGDRIATLPSRSPLRFAIRVHARD